MLGWGRNSVFSLVGSEVAQAWDSRWKVSGARKAPEVTLGGTGPAHSLWGQRGGLAMSSSRVELSGLLWVL